jgi:hypothetical protein
VRTSNVLTFAVHLPMADTVTPSSAPDSIATSRLDSKSCQASAPLPHLSLAGHGDVSQLGLAARRPAARGARRPGTTTRGRRSLLQAVGIPLCADAPSSGGRCKAPRRVVISQELARQLFPSDDPIGKRCVLPEGNPRSSAWPGMWRSVRGRRCVPMSIHSHSQFAGDRNWALTQVVALDTEPSPSVLAERSASWRRSIRRSCCTNRRCSTT